MNAFTRIAAATVLATGFAAAAQAQDAGPYIVGTGDNASVQYATPSQNILGGALTRTTGSGESAQTEILSVDHVQQGRLVSRVENSGDNVDVIYQDSVPGPRRAQGGARG